MPEPWSKSKDPGRYCVCDEYGVCCRDDDDGDLQPVSFLYTFIHRRRCYSMKWNEKVAKFFVVFLEKLLNKETFIKFQKN